jgi:MarR family transcriptional regulator, organic hydroperoxide resistance regulator
MVVKDSMQLKEFVCFALYSASRSMTQLYKCYLDQHGLTYPQFLALFILWKKNPRSVNEICDELLLDSGTVTPLLKRLERKGLVRRQRDSDDERVVRVFVTDDGAKLKDIVNDLATGMLCDIGLSAVQVRDMARTLQELRETIDASVARHRTDE